MGRQRNTHSRKDERTGYQANLALHAPKAKKTHNTFKPHLFSLFSLFGAVISVFQLPRGIVGIYGVFVCIVFLESHVFEDMLGSGLLPGSFVIVI
jgi:hypothetical protein